MLITTIANVVILSSSVVVLGLAGRLSEWNTTGFLWFVGSGLLTSFLGRNMLFTSIGRIGSSRAAAIKNTAPIFTVAVAVFFLAERLSPAAASGVGLACLGLFLLVYEAFRDPGTNQEQTDGKEGTAQSMLEAETLLEDGELASKPSNSSVLVVGALIAVLSAIFFGLGQAIRKVGIEYMPDAFVGAAIASWAALISYLVISFLRGRAGTVLKASFAGLRPQFWLAGVTTTVGQLGFFIAIMYAPVAHVSVIAASETLLTIFLAAVIIGHAENISRQIMIAAFLVFAGAAIVALF